MFSIVNPFLASLSHAGQESPEPSISTFLIPNPALRQDATLARFLTIRRNGSLAVSHDNWRNTKINTGNQKGAIQRIRGVNLKRVACNNRI
jgi:hypothetical protein